MLADQTIIEFLEETASDKPVPGGGSVAAQSGATAAALVEMVANLTIGKKAYADVSEEMKTVASKAQVLRMAFVCDIDRDSEAFGRVMEAFKLPKESEEEKSKRKRAIQEATQLAALVPLEVARRALEVIELSRIVVQKGNKNAITDGAVSAMMARTSALSAIYNVKINLNGLEDKCFTDKILNEINEIDADITAKEKEIMSIVQI